MNFDEITQYVLSIAPAITSVIGMVVSFGIGIGKIKKANRVAVDEIEITSKAVRERQAQLESQLLAVHRENAELKKEMTKVMKKIQHVEITED